MDFSFKDWHFTLASFFIFLSVWSFLTYGGFIEPFFLPSPSAVLGAAVTLFTEHDLISDIFASTYRVFAGFLLSAVFGVPLGILIGHHKQVKAFFEPLIGVARYLPIAAFIPLCILWFGIDDLSKIIFLFIGTFPYLALMTADVASDVEKHLIESAHTLGANRLDTVIHVVVPASLPGIFDNLRVCAAIGWTYVVVAELVAANSGLGYVIIRSQRFLQTSNILVCIVVIAFLGLATDCLFRFLRGYLFPWAKLGVML
ncbi:MAG: ABC transporter permease [Candidatus Altiarchaeota archaeon]|nr:ABC transporter permease [Candidatus Altiarchaeota archaeon]